MKIKNKIRSILHLKYLGFAIFTLLLVCCIELDSIDYEPTVEAGEVASFTMNIRVEPAENSAEGGERLIIGYCVPKSWNAASNTEVTYTSSIDEGVQTMSLVPEEAQPKNMQGRTWPAALRERFGFGPNVLDDMEWVVYQTDKVYNVNNGEKITVAVTLKTKTGMDNLRAKIGFFVNNSGDGLSTDTRRFKTMFTDCFEVVEGEGAVIDFCELHINTVQPLYADKNDLLTIKYQGDILDNILDDVDEIFLCATAYTDNGNTYDICDQGVKSQLRKDFDFGRTFSITFWPAGYFGIPEGENITKILYSFTNADGSVELTDVLDDDQNTEVPFEYGFLCK